MNYRHAYHAANFADVVKHAVLARILTYLNHKPAPYRVVDVHAGIGLYDLTGVEAGKTGEWEGGLGKVLTADLSEPLRAFLDPWLKVVHAENADVIRYYPGSPLVAVRMTRHEDALIFNELHPEDFELLGQAIGRDRRVKCLQLDAYTALKSLLPPPERRGVVLIDPPYEAIDEFQKLAKGLAEAVKRFATGVFMIWYPIKSQENVEGLYSAITEQGIKKVLRLELWTEHLLQAKGLVGTGLLVINPPWTLCDDAKAVWPELIEILASGPGAGGHVGWLVE